MKDIAVIGLGRFGYSIAVNYTKAGGSVLAIDKNPDKIQDISDIVTYAVKADVTNPEIVLNLGLSEMDVVVIGLSDSLEASVMATILSKEAGVPLVIVKAQNEVHGKILKRVGADRIIYPEIEMGARLARTLATNDLFDLVDIGENYSIVEVAVPHEWIGKSLTELNPRKKYGFNVIAKKQEGSKDIAINIDPLSKFAENDRLFVLGKNNDLDRVF